MLTYKSNARATAEQALAELKVPIPGIPKEVPLVDFGELPDLATEVLSSIMGQIADWYNFIITQVAFAEIDTDAANEEYEQELKRKMGEIELQMTAKAFEATGKSLRKEEMKPTLIKASAEIDRTVSDAKKRWKQQQAIHTVLKSRIDGYKELTFAISRELSARQGVRFVDGVKERAAGQPQNSWGKPLFAKGQG